MTINFDDHIQDIQSKIYWMERVYLDTDKRYRNAVEAGAELADAVMKFLADPRYDAQRQLKEAESKFMSKHAGNFYP